MMKGDEYPQVKTMELKCRRKGEVRTVVLSLFKAPVKTLFPDPLRLGPDQKPKGP